MQKILQNHKNKKTLSIYLENFCKNCIIKTESKRGDIMKNWLLGVIGCFAIIFCGFFVGCQQQTIEVKDLSLNSMPDVLTYKVGQDLQLTGGTLKVVYQDDSVQILPMTLATPSLTHFTQAQNDQIITLTYMGKTTKFGVSIEKGTLSPIISYTSVAEDKKIVVTDSYTGEPQNFVSHLNKNSIPQDDVEIKCFYKDQNADDQTYTQTAPTNAGNYDVKLSFCNSQNYEDLDMFCHYVVQKANLKDLVLQNNTLDYNQSALNQTQSTYGTTASLSLFWTQSDGYLGEVPLRDELKYQIEYAYKKLNDQYYITVQQNPATNQNEISLDVGQYMIKISIHDNTNINDEVLAEFKFVVVQKELVLGQDYDLYLFDGTTQTKIDQNFDVTFDESKTYELKLVSYVGQLLLNDGTTYYLGNSTMPTTSINSAGEYHAQYSIEGNQNYKSTGNQIITFVLN